jgi:hypothetical protein
MTMTGTLDSRATAAGLVIATRGTASQTFNAPAAALFAFLLVGQHTSAVLATLSDREIRSSGQLTYVVKSELFDELLKFHQALAGSQRELPEEAAKILRDNLWDLYD